jgi:hypothetical protein
MDRKEQEEKLALFWMRVVFLLVGSMAGFLVGERIASRLYPDTFFLVDDTDRVVCLFNPSASTDASIWSPGAAHWPFLIPWPFIIVGAYLMWWFVGRIEKSSSQTPRESHRRPGVSFDLDPYTVIHHYDANSNYQGSSGGKSSPGGGDWNL